MWTSDLRQRGTDYIDFMVVVTYFLFSNILYFIGLAKRNNSM